MSMFTYLHGLVTTPSMISTTVNKQETVEVKEVEETEQDLVEAPAFYHGGCV